MLYPLHKSAHESNHEFCVLALHMVGIASSQLSSVIHFLSSHLLYNVVDNNILIIFVNLVGTCPLGF